MLHPVPVTEKVTPPVPEPPDVVTVNGVPATPVGGELEMTNVACGAPVKVKATALLVWLV